MPFRRKKKNPSEDIKRLFQDSMLTGIPQIAAAGNWKKKFTRSAVFILCMGGFVYQTLTFMNMYWKYETVVDVQVFSPLEVEKPSYTICGQQGFLVNKFCKNPDKELVRKANISCQHVKEDGVNKWCECLPRICGYYGHLKNISVINPEAYTALNLLPREDIQKWIATEDDFIAFCEEDNFYSEDDQRDCYSRDNPNKLYLPCPKDIEFPESCFTRNSLVFNLSGKPDDVLSAGVIKLLLRPLEDEYPITIKSGRLFISFHNPYTVLNPMKDGILIEAGQEYRIYLSKVVKHLLEYPYETDCLDYLSMWRARGGHGPTNMQECIEECLRNISLERNGCLLEKLTYPGFDLRCPASKKDPELLSLSKECVAKNCKAACYDEQYTVSTTNVAYDHSFRCHIRDYKLAPKYAKVLVYLNGMETTVYSYSPKFEQIETFSYIGGYIGMWLGISLIAVFDFVETVVMLIRYPLRRMRRFRQRNRVDRFQPVTREVY